MSVTYKITDAIPLPSVGGGCSNCKYPFREMGVGQSFFVPNTAHQIRNTARLWAKNNGKVLSCRVVIENGEKGIRVWRVA